ncbi:LysM peptidoglycan-binding domain-containing protein [Rhabdochromatium marinum]|uniref:LysM peptidoglycan-binding domain-containing protein n=1 Tax=Rhabdochromatium marinum TaxID=48729 RepID=UPI001907532C|nr:LysM domain-containing protein [Rhabdochromatium marinum]MBK1650350.1 peptidoglycan-binding protein [Rhabdochromatium marinum]
MNIRLTWVGPTILGAAALLTALLAGTAGAVELRADHPERYEVRPGDTLWGIAARYLDAPWRWREIWEENPNVANPNRIYPGDILTVRYHGGQPRVGVEDGMRVVRLKPRVRTEALDVAIPTIPVSVLGPFLSRPVVANEAQIDAAPYVVGFPDDRVVAGVGDAIFVRSIFAEQGTRWEILRPGKEFHDYESDEPLGYEAVYVGSAELVQSGDPATLRITHSALETAPGDRLRPAEDEKPLRTFFPRPVEPTVRGHIISVLGGVSQIGQYDVVVLDRGRDNGIRVGDVFGIYRGGTVKRDRVRARSDDWNWRNESPLNTEFWFGDWEVTGWRRNQLDDNAPLPLHVEARRKTDSYVEPNWFVGSAMVFRSYPRVSFALIMSASAAIHVGNLVSAPPE